MSSPGAYQLNTVRFRNVNGFLVYTSDAALLIDTGYKGMGDQVARALKRCDLSSESLKLILLTHTHFDHAGGAAELKSMYPSAQLVVHRKEAELLKSGRASIPPGTRWKGKIISWVGRNFFPGVAKYDPCEHDAVIDNRMDLSPFGINGKVIHTPGHTLGSLTVLLGDGRALIGDNAMGIPGKPHFPPFAMDREGVLNSWEKIISAGSQWLYPAHGHRFHVDELIAELPVARARYL